MQKNKRLAEDVMCRAGLNPAWFPRVLQSGRVVGKVSTKNERAGGGWANISSRLAHARVISGLGDNHATGVGCGLSEGDFETIVISAGTSGTINRVCRANVPLAGNAACFEYYRDRLLLMMLADCCAWYDRFVARFVPDYEHHLDRLNDEVERADLSGVRRVLHERGKELYPPDWDRLSDGQKAASTQLSIMLELLLLVQAMLAEVPGAKTPISRFVLTGGLSQSPFLQKVFHVGIRMLCPKARLLISARKGPLRYQTAAYGALLNSMRPKDLEVAERLCPTRSIPRPDAATARHLRYLLQAFGLHGS
jgi:sugar (pentulose or hexulose) kinase